MRRRTLTRDRVIDAALAFVDRHGPDELSMRRLGAELGVEGMALYTHVRDKADLLDGIAVRILDELDTQFDPSAPWQERIRRAALGWAALQARHPRAFPLVYRTGTDTDVPRRVTEELFDALRTAGFDPHGTALAYQIFVDLVDGALLGRGATTDAGLQRVWRTIAKQSDPARYPRYAEVAPQAATLTWAETLESALDLLIAGLEQRLTAAG
jgi:AcrR family transcriptional regulator